MSDYERTLKLANLILFNDELDAGTLPEPRCSRCGNGVPVCVDVGLPCSEACRGFRPDMPICWWCEEEMRRELAPHCDCEMRPYHRWNCALTPVWAQTMRDLDVNPWTVIKPFEMQLPKENPAMECICGHLRGEHAFDEDYPERYSECWHRDGG